MNRTPLSFDELQQTYDGRLSPELIDLSDARQIWRKVNRAEMWVATCRKDARRAVQAHRDAVAGQFGIASLSVDARYDWEARTLLNLRDAYRRYRGAIRARKLLD